MKSWTLNPHYHSNSHSNRTTTSLKLKLLKKTLSKTLTVITTIYKERLPWKQTSAVNLRRVMREVLEVGCIWPVLVLLCYAAKQGWLRLQISSWWIHSSDHSHAPDSPATFTTGYTWADSSNTPGSWPVWCEWDSFGPELSCLWCPIGSQYHLCTSRASNHLPPPAQMSCHYILTAVLHVPGKSWLCLLLISTSEHTLCEWARRTCVPA